MSVQIILKYGNGEPALGQLVQGEVGVDITGKSLWTYNGSENIQLSGGDVNLGQLPDVDIGGGNFITIEELAILVGQNQADITELEGRVSQNEGDISTNATDIKTNASEIGKLDGRVEALETWQSEHEAAVGNLLIALDELQKQVDANETRSKENAKQIGLIWDELGLVESGLSYAGGYNAATNLIASVSDFAASKGVSSGQSLNTYVGAAYKGLYFIVTQGGTLQNSGGDGSQDGQECYSGDWLVCDGTKYVLLNYQMETVSFGQIGGDPYDNDALKLALDAKISRDNDVIEGGNYTPARTYANRND